MRIYYPVLLLLGLFTQTSHAHITEQVALGLELSFKGELGVFRCRAEVVALEVIVPIGVAGGDRVYVGVKLHARAVEIL